MKTSDPGAWDVAIGGMFDVANAPYGSARYYLQVEQSAPPYKMAGKSGTAQVFTVAITERVRKAGELAEHMRRSRVVRRLRAGRGADDRGRRDRRERAPRGGSAYASPIARRILDAYLLSPEEWAAQEEKLAVQEAVKRKAAAAAAAARGGRRVNRLRPPPPEPRGD